MNCKTHELYDENEYFLKFLIIHPILIYSNKPQDLHKKKFQQYLLDKFNKEEIDYDQLKHKYDIIVNYEQKNKIFLEQIKEEQNQFFNKIKEYNINRISNVYDILYEK